MLSWAENAFSYGFKKMCKENNKLTHCLRACQDMSHRALYIVLENSSMCLP